MNYFAGKELRAGRCFAALSILLIIVFVCCISMSANADSVTEHKMAVVTVCKGDTLWGIACEYGDQKDDVRELVHQIKKLNNLETAIIMPGSAIYVPID